MDRRTFLAAAGVLAGGTAGCLGGGDDGSNSKYETLSVGDVTVPLVPVDTAHSWYQEGEPHFVDARGPTQYDRAHVTNAVLSPARKVENWSNPRSNDPTADWPTDAQIVCYCQCPHHLSSLRAGELISNGYENVYAIDEGFGAWMDRGYPTTGSDSNQASFVIRGRSDAGDAGGYAWATHEPSDQREAAPIADDGSYEMTLYFGDLDPDAPIHVETPSYELTAPLSDLTERVVDGSME